ncbi:hypothetical protein X907_0556 [Glycocaulis alkaliphilus]|uniref:Uncharacterized protein n=1 Tax=Glycocaulis alkaliphilus TaxID=1434191 RepID=A0A3T0E6V1_9PROT|nr:hypothetical protein [Glycocaulis alkaliphilus]AZU03103.1 hypothetical protein X907_0556 [Glycocaulis alkaliphilus]GGB71009.1 hypothetical protein GCM10007417_08490 [Glycocaulis alkaliphilus]
MRPEIIVHLGSGLCSELDDYAGSAEKVVLVEAQPDIAAQLRESAARYANVDVICGAVRKDGGGGTAPFAVFNVSEVSGFCPPGALKAMLPRLSEVRKIAAGLMDLNSVLTRYQALGLPYRVIVDVNGLEGEIIEALAEPASGYFVSDIRVHCGLHALYEGGLSAAEVESRLLESGFRDVVSEGSGPVRTVRGHRSLAVYIDTLIERERASLRTLQQSSAQAYAGALEQVDLLTAELERVRSEGEASRSALEGQLAERLAQRDMAREREKANFEALETAKRQLADKEAELERLHSEGEAARTELESLQQSSAQAYAGALEQVDLLTAEMESLRSEGEASRSALESQLAERLAERDTARERERANFEALENAKRQLADKEEELERVRFEGEASRSELEGQLAERLAERDTAREREKANFEALENAKRQVQAAESELERLRTALASSERNVEDRQNENKRLQQELDTAREDLRLSLRIQRLAQADLAELQQRYAESVSQRADIENQISGLIEHFQLEDARKSALAKKPALPAGQNRRPVNKTKSRSAKGK